MKLRNLILNLQELLCWWVENYFWLQNKQLMCFALKRFASETVRLAAILNFKMRPWFPVVDILADMPGFHSYASLLEFCFTVSFCPHTWGLCPPFAIEQLPKNPSAIHLSHVHHPKESLLQHIKSTPVLRNCLHSKSSRK